MDNSILDFDPTVYFGQENPACYSLCELACAEFGKKKKCCKKYKKDKRCKSCPKG